MTSLASQLATIARTSTNALDLKAQKAAHSKSLLFEPRVAGAQSWHTLYQLCYEGFRELCQLDSRFIPFGKNIFSEQSITEERQQMTAEENKRLDTVIESFLQLVGAKILLKPAVKAVEWLIRRFRIHEQNTECLILTFLPYHSDPLFTTLLSILPKSITPTYRFLYPYMTSYTNPPRQTIIYSATNTPAFFSALNTYVLKTVKVRHHYHALISFWASVTVQAIDGQLDAAASGREAVRRQKEEEVLLRVLPVLNEALSMKDVSEIILACCMIMIVLAAKADLDDPVLDRMMEALIKNSTFETTPQCLVCLAVLAQKRSTPELTRLVARHILKLKNIKEEIQALSQRCDAGELALGCALAALKSGSSDGIQLVESIILGQNLDEYQYQVAFQAIIDRVSSLSAATDSTERASLGRIIKQLNEDLNTATIIETLLQKNDTSVEELEMSLSMVIRAPIKAETTTEEDVEMKDIETPSSLERFNAAMSELPETIDRSSFLNEQDDQLYYQLEQVFLAAVSSAVPESMSRFSQYSYFQHNQTLFVTFLMRFWCSGHPALARQAALNQFNQSLAATADDSKLIDYQAVLPYMLWALMDQSTAVRKSAGQGLTALVQAHRRLQKDDGSSKTEPFTPYGFQNSSDKAPWLKYSDLSKFLETILIPNIKQIAIDSSQLSATLMTALDSDKEKSDLKSSVKTSIIAFIASNSILTPLLNVRIRLLPLVNGLGKLATSARQEYTIPSFERWAALSNMEAESECRKTDLEVRTVNTVLLEAVRPREENGLASLQSIIKGKLGNDRVDLQLAAHDRLRVIWPNMKGSSRLPLAQTLLELAMAPTGVRADQALQTLRDIELSGDILASFVDSLPSVTAIQHGQSGRATKRMKTSESAKADVGSGGEMENLLKRYTLVLELVESSSPEKYPELLKGLFRALGEIQELKSKTESELVYVQSLALSTLLSVVQAISKGAPIDKTAIRPDLLVECVRGSSSPQVQNTALLVVSALAASMPDTVLHAVMPIFTFISTSTLRATDEYSAHVIDETITHVIPPLAASLRRRNRVVVEGTSELLLSFVTAFEHIPQHRRLGLFNRLVCTVGAADSLYAVLAMLIDKHSANKRVLTFAQELVGDFDARIQLLATQHYLNLVADTMKPKQTISNVLLNWKEKTPEQKETSRTDLLNSLAELLTHQDFKDRLGQALKTGEDVRKLFSEVVEAIVRLTIDLRGQPASAASERVLVAALRALPVGELVKSVEGLLDRHDDEVRRIVLQSLVQQIIRIKQDDKRASRALLDFLSRVMSVIQTSNDLKLKLTAISCIDRVSEKFGKLDTSTILAAAQTVAGPAALGSDEAEVRIMALLCLASVVEVLKQEFIPLLPQVLKLTFSYLADSIKILQARETSTLSMRAHNAAFQLLNAVAENLPFMISGNDLDAALKLSQQSASVVADNEGAEHRRWFGTLVAKTVDSTATFSALERTLDNARQTGPKALHEHLTILADAVKHHPKSIIVNNAQPLSASILSGFDTRFLVGSETTSWVEPYKHDDLTAVDEVDQQLNEVALGMIMKLNENTFRPIFVRMVEWATQRMDQRARMLRSRTFYTFLDRFFGQLKSIVTQYSSYLIDHSVTMLSAKPVSSAVEDDKASRNAIMSALQQSFEYDQDDFWQTPSHFTPLADALLSLFALIPKSSNPVDVDALIATITSLAAAANSPDHHKTINTAILKLMRDQSASIRLAAVKCEQSLTEKLGEDWLGLLAEMLPFISELLEDEDEGVEREARRWVLQVEGVLGEDVLGMLQ